MRSNMRNTIKLYWHCLLHFHRMIKLPIGQVHFIGCADCEYLNCDVTMDESILDAIERSRDEKYGFDHASDLYKEDLVKTALGAILILAFFFTVLILTLLLPEVEL